MPVGLIPNICVIRGHFGARDRRVLIDDGFWSEKPPDRGSADAQASCDFALTEAISVKGLDLAGR